jgi:hypothetical protein
MGLLRQLVLGRWFTRWLLRGGPWSVAAKLAAVALFGAWKWRREKKQALAGRAQREIEASYEVLDREGGTSTAGDG